MKNLKMKTRVAAITLTAMAGFAPVAFSAEQGLAGSQAVCDTCCAQEKSTCIIGDYKIADSWHKAETGPCSATQPAPPPTG
jgi:hypothetical protein